MAQVKIVRKSPPPIPGTVVQAENKQSEMMRLAQTLSQVSVEHSKQENEVEKPKTLQEQYPNHVLFDTRGEDEIEKHMRWKEQEMKRGSSNAVNAEFCSTAMGIVLAFLTGGLFLPFLLYHLLHGDREVKKVQSRYDYLWGNPELNAAENLTEEDKQYFYDHPMAYKVGLNQYKIFEPEEQLIQYTGVWGYKSKNPRFAKDEDRDLWWNKPYWDIIEEQHEKYVKFDAYHYNKYEDIVTRYYQRKILFERGEVPKGEVEYWENRRKEVFDYWVDCEIHFDPGSFMYKFYGRQRNEDGFLDPKVVLESYHNTLNHYNKYVSRITKDQVVDLLCNKMAEPDGFSWRKKLTREEDNVRCNLQNVISDKKHLDLYKNYFKELTGEEFPEEEE